MTDQSDSSQQSGRADGHQRRDNLQCVALDVVGTLLYPDPPAAAVYAEVGRRFGCRLSEAEVARRFRTALSADDRQPQPSQMAGAAEPQPDSWSTSEAEEQARWRRIVESVLLETTPVDIDREACFEALFRHFARPDAWKCYDDVPAAVSWLQQAGYTVALASNFDARLHPVCEGFPALRNIRHRAVSSEVGYRKPSPAFYRALSDMSGIAPERILMVGDHVENDVRGAKNAGLQAALLQRDPSRRTSVGEDSAFPVISSLSELPLLLSPGGPAL